MQWFKEGQAIDTSKQETKFAVKKKKSETREGETIVQLEIKVNCCLISTLNTDLSCGIKLSI